MVTDPLTTLVEALQQLLDAVHDLVEREAERVFADGEDPELDTQSAVRLGRQDPDVCGLLTHYERSPLIS